MKTPALVLLAAMTCIALPGVAASQDKAPAYTPLRPVSECLRPDRINEWYVVDSSTVIARTGPDRYLVKLQAKCPQLGIGQSLRFRANRSNEAAGMGAMCGEAGETVASRDQPPCAVQSIAKIDKAQFDKLSSHSKQHGTLTP
ncbi:MAG TPA: DUF6491 family protein [Dyella sp.]|uniref:DUF6491 family protein n=1 Tax=Dyella sp. TaxID=1869338 RepID=UPI002D78C9D1|nr:DUF6491 family protein [Dyella sp.]HET6551988.1 DUF6491 family protein [Dyella sp.]